MEGTKEALAELLKDRYVLIVIDDVWNADHLKPFLFGGAHCAHLITTRYDETLPKKSPSSSLWTPCSPMRRSR
jgi:hypothetical protein